MKKAAGLVFGKGNIGGTGGGEAPPLNPGVRGEVLLKPGNPKGWIMSSKGNFVPLGSRLRVSETSKVRSREEGLTESGGVGAGEGLSRR